MIYEGRIMITIAALLFSEPSSEHYSTFSRARNGAEFLVTWGSESSAPSSAGASPAFARLADL